MRARLLGVDVFQAAVERMVALYASGHRLVISFSGGKDSSCVLNVCLIAARETGRLPVDVVMMDEEVMFPGLVRVCRTGAPLARSGLPLAHHAPAEHQPVQP
jgi:predicted phosphoadenosine phosphosulfate sulfurtransferase